MQITANIQVWDRELDIIREIVERIKPSQYTVVFHADGSVTIGAWNAAWPKDEDEFAAELKGIVEIRKIVPIAGLNPTYGTITYQDRTDDCDE
jgi:hypothetical protein